MSFSELMRRAGVVQYDMKRVNEVRTLARFFKNRGRDNISWDEAVKFAAQIIGNFDYKYRTKRKELEKSSPYTIKSATYAVGKNCRK